MLDGCRIYFLIWTHLYREVRKKSSFSNCKLKAPIVFSGLFWVVLVQDCRLWFVNFVVCDQFCQPFGRSGNQIVDSRRYSAEYVLELILH